MDGISLITGITIGVILPPLSVWVNNKLKNM